MKSRFEIRLGGFFVAYYLQTANLAITTQSPASGFK